MDLEQGKIAVLGLARSGEAAALALIKRGAQVTVIDHQDASRLGDIAQRVQQAGALLHLGDDFDLAVLEGIQMLVLSPGIPGEHPLRKAALERRIEVIGEMELGYRLRPDIKYLAVTGSNGKTTCASLLAAMLARAGLPGIAAGNIGTPLCSLVDTHRQGDPLAIEVSSYQLRDASSFHAHVGMLLNISPDHLDVHGSWEEYVRCKAAIFRNQTESDYAVFFVDDPVTADIARQVPSQQMPFSISRELPQGGFVRNGVLVLHHGELEVELGTTEDFQLQGPHNHANILAAGLAALAVGVPPEALTAAAQEFKPLPHRLEPCGELGGVLFINDSKATNVDSVMMALRSQIRPVVLIAGNYDKDGDFKALIPLLRERVKAAVLIGKAAPKIFKAWHGIIPIEVIPWQEQEERPVPGMADAVRRAWELARPNGVVLLSPACASFDMYRNYENRGDVFKEEVARLIAEEGGA
jgi:UDP-N-acetylmuramoylalanine--D-glutamate ligase